MSRRWTPAIDRRQREHLVAFGSSTAVHALLFFVLVGVPRYVARSHAAGRAPSFEVTLVVPAPAVAAPAPPHTHAPPSSVPAPSPAPRVRGHGLVRAVPPAVVGASPAAPPTEPLRVLDTPSSASPELPSAPVLAAPTREDAHLLADPGTPATSGGDAMLLGSASMGRGVAGVIGGRGGAHDDDGIADGAGATTDARCGDAINGVWTALLYSERYRDWHRFTLHIDRRGDLLVGEIIARWWDGGPSARTPGPCGVGGMDYQYRMSARGHVEGDRVSFFSTSFERDHLWCGRDPGYNRDAFSGTLVADEERLDTVNDDGGRTLHEPARFHRTGCWDRSH
jgi:hypothetical protein